MEKGGRLGNCHVDWQLPRPIKSAYKGQVMDDAGHGNGNSAIALVARQFAPSRIERELLAQVFDLVCEGWQPAINSSTGRRMDDQLVAPSDREWSADGTGATLPQLAGRAAS